MAKIWLLHWNQILKFFDKVKLLELNWLYQNQLKKSNQCFYWSNISNCFLSFSIWNIYGKVYFHFVNLAPGLQIQNCGSPITKVKLKLTLTYLTLNCTIDSSKPLIGHWLVTSEYTITQVLFLLITFELFPKLTYCTSNSYLVVLLSLDCQVMKMFELVVPSFK